jgi:hypothetical protein
VDLPGGERENLLIFEEDDIESIVEVFSLNHCKILIFNLLELDRGARKILLNKLKDLTFDSHLVERNKSLKGNGQIDGNTAHFSSAVNRIRPKSSLNN